MTDQTERDRIITALYDARRPGLGGMTEAQAVGYMADAVVAALARAHQPAGHAPVADQAAFRARLVSALDTAFQTFVSPLSDAGVGLELSEHLADAALSEMPAPTDRAAVLREAADELDRYVGLQSSDAAPEVEGARLVIRELRRIAGQPSPVDAGKCGCYSPSGAYRCTQPAGHLGYHRHVRPDSDEWSSWVTGTAEPGPPAVEAQQPKEA